MFHVDSLMTKILQRLSELFTAVDEITVDGISDRFLAYFTGFDEIEAVKKIFGEKTTEILRNINVEFSFINGYMHIDSTDGHIVISKNYIKNGNKIDIYLDLIHELFHVKQFMNGQELFDKNYKYVDRPTEIEAYRYTVQEAKRIGLTEKYICQYLKTEWINDTDLKRLLKAVNIHNYDLPSNASV
ncbi:MAG: hypothetical protein FWF66_01320 [Candidatus Bathyarchaeota archaeon]|nr:hypothetical protein [Candidatus Termiticorpusculum sp.]MCL1970093.1 hypothetical protein [Candidatus Termiticorpusculum sp.]